MSTTAETLLKISNTLQDTANPSVVYGEPIRLEDKVVVPVSKIALGFGAGGIDNLGQLLPDAVQNVSPSGGGGGMIAYPVGALEITAGKTKFISASNPRSWIMWLVSGFLLGSFMKTRKKSYR